MILLIGSFYDEMIELMCARLRNLKFGFFLIDPEEAFSGLFTSKSGKKDLDGMFLHSGKRISHDNITGIYIRPANSSLSKKIKGMTMAETKFILNENFASLMNFIEYFPGRVVNRPGKSLSNGSKLYQQIEISGAGFYTPKTIVTNKAEKVFSFYEECNKEIIFKSISSVRSIVTKFTPRHFPDTNLLKNCPVLFQELIKGLEIRVHTVGKKVFATAIETDAIDYRYARKFNMPVKFSDIKLPFKIEKACVLLSEYFGLEVAGIDLKKTSDGKYYCFEVNPSPGFLTYERATLQPISKEVAILLKDRSKIK